MTPHPAPALKVGTWLNTPKPLRIEDFRGRVLLIEAFQMLCPGCVSTGLPQIQRVARLFPEGEVAIIGLHTVFEHHAAQGSEAALSAFAHEYRLTFPIGIDQQDEHLPKTMAAYGMRGTPTLVVVDRKGYRRFQHLGHVEDLALGHILGTLLAEAHEPDASEGCSDGICRAPDS